MFALDCLLGCLFQNIKKNDENIRMTFSKQQFPQGKTFGIKPGLQNQTVCRYLI